MRIALDGSDLAAGRFEGPAVYAGELLPRLSRLLAARGHQVVTYAPAPLVGVSVAGEVQVIPGSPFWTQRVLPRALFRDRPDVLFLPIQMLPLARPASLRTVAVVHDLEFLHFPETYTPADRLLLRFFTARAVRDATKLIAVSQYTKDDVAKTYGRNSADITVVRHGVDPKLFSSEERRREQEVRDHARARYAIPQPYILFVGSLQPRKNVAGLVAAFERLSTFNVQRLTHLVIVAGGSWKEAGILARIVRSPVRDRIHVVRRVPREDLPVFYRNAEAFILPSFSEGFGMPVLEAMACGTPVVVSDTSSLPEVAGDAAVLVDPNDPKAIAAALSRVLTDAVLRARLVERGSARAKQFSWDTAAEATDAVIESAGNQASVRQ